jgi:F-type H+-transporting ATPase subunit delta
MIEAREFAKALFLISEEEGSSDAMLEDVMLADAVFTENPTYVKLLDTPAIEKSEKLSLIDGSFGAVNENLKNLIKILCQRHSVYAYSRVAAAYSELYDTSRGIERVVAVTAIKMTDKQLSALAEKLEKITSKRVIIKNETDPAILGGIKLRYMGVQMDYTLRSRLDAIERSLANTVL